MSGLTVAMGRWQWREQSARPAARGGPGPALTRRRPRTQDGTARPSPETQLRGDHMGEATRAHLIAGGFPPGSSAGHDHDYARLRLLGLLAEQDVPASVASDFADVERWLPVSR